MVEPFENASRLVLDPFSEGFLLGILVGEGHFGGDGRSAQVTLRMHVRHLGLFLWLQRIVPESKLYGPYHHGGRSYYQWMARGVVLRERLWPVIARRLDFFDDHVRERILTMARKYGLPPPDQDPAGDIPLGSSGSLRR